MVKYEIHPNHHMILILNALNKQIIMSFDQLHKMVLELTLPNHVQVYLNIHQKLQKTGKKIKSNPNKDNNPKH